MTPTFELSEIRRILRDHLPLLAARFGVASLGLFGSRVRGEAGPDSDLDILVRFRETPGLLRYIELEDYLSQLLGLRVDLVMADALKPRAARHALAELLPV